MRFLSNLRGGNRRLHAGQPGRRAYAVGDIHGRLDLLEQILVKIESDAANRPARKTYIVFLGDLIDRGPDSAAVVERLRTYLPAFAKPVFIAGNHEEVFLRILTGDAGVLKDWLSFGGAECAQSYGVDPEQLGRLDPSEGIERLRRAIPRDHVDFLQSFADTFRFGDYLFVHAGIRPGVDLLDQDQFDLRWIREPFLSSRDDHGFMVVHGHTIVREVEEHSNRICIDTGAYYSGLLTAVGIEGADRWFLSAVADKEPSHPVAAA